MSEGQAVSDAGTGPVIALAVNTSWNLVNFRANIIAGLQQRGSRVAAIAPRDGHSAELETLGVEFSPLDFRSAGVSPLGEALLFVRYWTLLRRLRPAAFLGFTIKPNIMAARAAIPCSDPN